jgi:hypothetical protein
LIGLEGAAGSLVSAEAEGAGELCPLTGTTSGTFEFPGVDGSDDACVALPAVAPLAAGATSGPACKKERAATNATSTTPKNSAASKKSERRDRPG